MLLTDSNLLLNIQNLSCGYGGKSIINDFNLQVTKGDIIAITGPNGSGKSTVLKAIYQLCIINGGQIDYKGESLLGKYPEKIRKMGIAWFMQKDSIFPKLSVQDNLILSLNGINRQLKKIKIKEIVAKFSDIESFISRPAGLLSGGQRQQLAMAMLIMQDADLWLLDEPTAGLDKEKTELFISQVLEYNRNSNNHKTVIFVEHKNKVITSLATKKITL